MEIYFWKKFLNTDLINFDKRLLKNFYLNQGFYDVEINSSFAQILKDNTFELIFNIDANEKFYFGDLKISLPDDFQSQNYNEINSFLKKLRGEPYSINSVEKIINKIDLITTNEEFKTIKAFVNEKISDDNVINLDFVIEETR